MSSFFDLNYELVYPTPSPDVLAKAFINRLWRKLHIENFSLLIVFYGKHRCLTEGNKVLMASGCWKNIEDVREGDNVFSPQKDGSILVSKVLQTTRYFCDDVYDVVEAKGKKRLLYSCSNNHNIPLLYYCSKRNGNLHGKDLPRTRTRKIKEYPAEYITKYKKALQSRMITFTSPPIDFKQNNAEIDPYCLGLWLGDGHCSIQIREHKKSFLENPSRYLNKKYLNTLKISDKAINYAIGITTNDPEIICSFKQRYDEINSIGAKQGTTAVMIRITSTGLFFKHLQKLGLIGTKSGTKFIPKECLLSSVDFRLQLLAGLIDTDGYVCNNANNIEITSKSLKLANDILDMVHSLGGNGTVTKVKKKIKSIDFEGTYYTARFAFNKKILFELTKHVQVKRKKERILKHINIADTTNSNHKIYDPRNISINCIHAKPQMVYGFTLDSESHWFITNNWIVTCNSGKSLSATSLAYILDETFEQNLEKRIVYSSRDTLAAFKEIREKRIKGAAVIIDEAGSGDLSNTRWYEEASKIISSELQAVGYLNPFIGFVTQNFSFINTTARKLSQGVFEVSRTNNLYTTIKPYWIETSPFITGIHRRYPIFCENREGIPSNVYKLSRIKMGMPPLDIRHRYEAHSQAYKDRLLVDSEQTIQALEMDKKKGQVYVEGIEAIVTEIVNNKNAYMTRSHKAGVKDFLNAEIIRHRHSLPAKDSKLVKALAEQQLHKKLTTDSNPV